MFPNKFAILASILGAIHFVSSISVMNNDLDNMPKNSYTSSNNASTLVNSPITGSSNAWACINLSSDSTQKKLFIDMEGGKIYSKYSTQGWKQL